jgi:tight adherence protein B
MRFEIFVLYFLTALLALEGLSALLRRRADPVRVRNRLQALAQSVAQAETEQGGSLLRSSGGLRLPSLAGLEVLLYRAGGPLSVGRFCVLSAVVACCGFLTVFVLTEDPLRSIPALLLGLIPWLFVRRAAAKRTRDFEEQLPDALELMTRCMRTGHALGAGFQMVGQEFADPIATEFGLVAEEIRMGLEVREALENLMNRVDNDDLPYFTTAVLIQRQTGGNLAELLDKLSTLLRERSQFHGRVRALTAQGRGAATFLALWLPFIILLVWVIAPSYLMPLVENDWGHAVLATAFGIDALAYYISLRIADVQT